jgi:hypothetical protein
MQAFVLCGQEHNDSNLFLAQLVIDLTMQIIIGKNLSSLPDFSRIIAAKERFKAQL